MPKINRIFHEVPVEINNKSTFDMSFENIFTAECGTITPLVSQFLLPGDTVNLGFSGQVQLPPSVTDFYGKISAKLEAFFVPARLLYGGWQQLVTHDDNPLDVDGLRVPEVTLPPFAVTNEISNNFRYPMVGNGTLADFLGYNAQFAPIGSGSIKQIIPNILKFIAYHKIYDDWYRDSRVQKPVFDPRKTLADSIYSSIDTDGEYVYPYVGRVLSPSRLPQFTFQPEKYQTANLEHWDGYLNTYGLPFNGSPFRAPEGDATFTSVFDCFSQTFDDGHPWFSLRQRNWTKDYFTNATALPQAGQSQSVSFEVDNDGNGSFSIASLRAANSIQQWLERNNLVGYRYGDQINARFGIYPSDATLQRSIYLGSSSFDIYNKSIYQQAPANPEGYNGLNPFTGVGSKYGSPMGVSNGGLVRNFTATEYGYLFVNFTLVPYAVYSAGVDRHLSWYRQTDIPDPLLAGVGDQPIYMFELENTATATNDKSLFTSPDPVSEVFFEPSSFAYTQRYADSKFINDQIHGIMRDTSGQGAMSESLKAFALQRGFGGPTFGTEFIQIPKSYLDQVLTANVSQSGFSCWSDFYFDFKKTTTLPAYSIPTLGEPKNTHTKMVPNGGTRL